MKKIKSSVSSYEYQREAEFFFSSTPHPKQWFEFLGWITAFSTLQFLTEKTGSLYIKIIYYISYAVLFNFIQKNLWMKKFQNYLPSKISDRSKAVVTFFISTLSVAMMYLFISKFTKDLINGLQS